ncbi:E3 ubiquitin-protein ligase ZNF598 [Erpetoichthys calabaricus]|uniref:RING-type E3 ubiquitin transferase n=1 Tax=Erpetoichthys calabaricus TaxID=27687 RepID=A0A8C4XAK8_ERPCA|nr:E3 ubiquitin-protein ligase ZNF598 [Erpetoichthys calabaricus]
MASKLGKESEGSCVLCCQEIDIYALGKCDHPVCFRCSTKMRVLCEQKYCAVCREELDKVLFVKKPDQFSTITTQNFQCEKKYDIYFSDPQFCAQFRRILQHECPQCKELKIFNKFEDLEQHMRKQHELFCCKLCAKHLKIFTHERKWYSRKELARHRMQGDPDDTSHRGHPLCKFCDDRYLDNDELLKHLRRDHYFCHFCDSDGGQEYYSDYDYLREHFREKHFLCEEGRCNTEQFTHAFRTEIDYKAHKAAAHSKNRAEARQNRHIDLQFNYAPRHQRRNEGVVGGEDYEEVERFNRNLRGARGGGRGGQQNLRGSWRYNREEEDREIAAAVRASVAARRREEKRQAQERELIKPKKEETVENEDFKNSRSLPKQSSDIPGKDVPAKTVNNNGPLRGEDFPALGSATPCTNKLAEVKLKEDDFPSLSSTMVSGPMTPAYTAATRKQSAFLEDDFPALVSKIKPQKSLGNTCSAWLSSSNKNVTNISRPVSSNSPISVYPTKTSTTALSISSSSQQKKKTTSSKGNNRQNDREKSIPSSDEDDGQVGKTTQEIRSVPTMLDISSLLTEKSSVQSISKIGKRKKVGGEKQNTSALLTSVETVKKVSQKENVPETKSQLLHFPQPINSTLVNEDNLIIEHLDNSIENKNPPIIREPPGLKKTFSLGPNLLPDEDFPALLPKQPPPGFSATFPLKNGPVNISPPPGYLAPASKPPPGFTGVPLNINTSENANSIVGKSVSTTGMYTVPDNFQQRNMELIQTIRNFLQNEESRFNEFKTYSRQFRQGQMSATHYHKSCQELLGDNFKLVFNELLVLLPDTSKQQELLSAHKDICLQENQGCNKPKKNKINAWQSNSTSSNKNSLELDCQVCPHCLQVLTEKDFVAHKIIHREDDDFPSLQAISKIIS